MYWSNQEALVSSLALTHTHMLKDQIEYRHGLFSKNNKCLGSFLETLVLKGNIFWSLPFSINSCPSSQMLGKWFQYPKWMSSKSPGTSLTLDSLYKSLGLCVEMNSPCSFYTVSTQSNFPLLDAPRMSFPSFPFECVCLCWWYCCWLWPTSLAFHLPSITVRRPR